VGDNRWMDGWMDGWTFFNEVIQAIPRWHKFSSRKYHLQFYAIHEVLVVNSNSTDQWMKNQNYMDGISWWNKDHWWSIVQKNLIHWWKFI
jgi:hypothetical protein